MKVLGSATGADPKVVWDPVTNLVTFCNWRLDTEGQKLSEREIAEAILEHLLTVVFEKTPINPKPDEPSPGGPFK